MARLTKIRNFFNATTEEEGVLLPTFQDLLETRRQVPYLRDLGLKSTSAVSGNMRSSFKGRGMEFAEVRAYSLSDDARDIDWRVTARKNQPFTKLYTEEKDREVYVWLDMSVQMRFGTKKELKSVTAAKTAALVGWYALQNKDRFGLALYNGQKTRIFDAARTQENLLHILKQIEKSAAETLYVWQNTESAGTSLQKLQKKLSNRAIVFVLSAFDDIENNFERTLAQLSRRHEVYAVCFYDKLEDIPPPQGQYIAQNENVRVLLENNGKTFEHAYQAYFSEKRATLKEKCAQYGCRYREIRTDFSIARQLKPI